MANNKSTPPGGPDYGNQNPTGGTRQNEGQVNPSGPSSGTANWNPERKDHKHTGATPEDSEDESAPGAKNSNQMVSGEISTARFDYGDTQGNNFAGPGGSIHDIRGGGNMAVGPISGNPGDTLDLNDEANPGADIGKRPSTQSIEPDTSTATTEKQKHVTDALRERRSA